MRKGDAHLELLYRSLTARQGAEGFAYVGLGARIISGGLAEVTPFQ
jgi:hypothetical protein